MWRPDGRPFIIILALFAALGVAATAGATSLVGTVDASRIYLSGDVDVTSTSAVTVLQSPTAGFAEAPRITLSAQEVTVHKNFRHLAGSSLVGAYPLEPAQRDSVTLQGVTADFLGWNVDRNVFGLQSTPSLGVGEGRLRGALPAATPLEVTSRERTIHLLPGGEDNREVGESAESIHVPTGSIVLGHETFAGAAEYFGDFRVYVYGATYELHGEDGKFRAETGHRQEERRGIGSQDIVGTEADPSVETFWINTTILEVVGGSLRVESPAHALESFSVGPALLQGEGVLFLEAHDGNLQDMSQRTYALDDQDLNLVGRYDARVEHLPEFGFRARIQGEFQSQLLSLAIPTGPSPLASLWPFLLVGAAVVAGGSGVLLMRNQRAKPAAPIAPPAEAEPVREARAPSHHGSLLGWDELEEDYGLIRAAEQAGVVVVLVSAARVDAFLKSVTARGLIAEDTGDRVHAAGHEMAVVTLEPSPLMLN